MNLDDDTLYIQGSSGMRLQVPADIDSAVIQAALDYTDPTHVIPVNLTDEQMQLLGEWITDPDCINLSCVTELLHIGNYLLLDSLLTGCTQYLVREKKQLCPKPELYWLLQNPVISKFISDEDDLKYRTYQYGENLPPPLVNVSNPNTAFIIAAGNGHLEVLKWLHSTYTMSADDARVDDNHAFCMAAQNGHLEVLKWLHSTFSLKAEDARTYNNYAFRWAARLGHLEVLKWLYNTYNLTVRDVRVVNNYAFRLAALSGHLEVLKWLHSTFDLTAVNARANNNYAFREAAFYGHLDVLKWLHGTYNLTVEDARAWNNWAFRWAAAENGHPEVLKWLRDTFGLTAEDVHD